jgi:hypothetical protein
MRPKLNDPRHSIRERRAVCRFDACSLDVHLTASSHPGMFLPFSLHHTRENCSLRFDRGEASVNRLGGKPSTLAGLHSAYIFMILSSMMKGSRKTEGSQR